MGMKVMRMLTHRARRGFSMVELLTVVAIAALLIALLIPAIGASRARARQSVCQSNLRQLGGAWQYYVVENRDSMPGNTFDYIEISTNKPPPSHPGYPVNYMTYRSYDWLGTIGQSGDQTADVPVRGTIYPYIRNVAAYRCPEDRVDVAEHKSSGVLSNETLYSYTSPPLLSGVAPDMIASTRWADGFPSNHDWKKWNEYTRRSLPWIFIEEDEGQWLALMTDGAWFGFDAITNRHGGGGSIAHIDGSVRTQRFQRSPGLLDATRVYFELRDGRIVSARHWYDTKNQPIRFGYLRTPFVSGVLYKP